MDIVGRNFLRLLKCGSFGIMEDLELMSNFKWKKLIKISQLKGCPGIIFDGMKKYTKEGKLTIGESLQALWMGVITQTEAEAKKMNECVVEMYNLMSAKLHYPVLMRGREMALLYDNPLHYICDYIDWWIPTEEKAREADAWAMREAKIISDADKDMITYSYLDTKVRNNHYVVELMDNKLNKELHNIVIREKSYYKPFYVEINGANVEILPPSVLLLMLILNLAQHILIDKVLPTHIIDLGIYLRKLGDKVDYIKLERWLEQLKMQQMADIIGGLLVQLFSFTQDEIPFMKKYNADATDNIIMYIFSEEQLAEEDRFAIGKNTKKNLKQLIRSATNIKYQPREITGGYVKKVRNLFTRVEE